MRSRRELLATLGTLAAGSFFSGCGIVSKTSASSSAQPDPPSPNPPSSTPTPSNPTQPSNPQPVPAGAMAPTTVTIAATQAGNMPGRFVGLSFEKSRLSSPVFTGSNTNFISMFKRLGSGVLRIGGNSVDQTNWAPNGPGQTSGQTSPSDVNALAAFASATRWPVLYGVNLAQSTPSVAAAEAAYAAKALGSNLLGIEIGNEPDLYAGTYFPSTWVYANYQTLWQSFASAIQKETPGIPLTGPVTAWSPTWFSSFAQADSKESVLLSMHYYRANGALASSTISEMISYPDTTLNALLAQLKSAAQAAGVPYRMAETNSFYGDGAPNVSDAFASALWAIDEMFTVAQYNGVGVNYHGGGDGNSFTPIADNNGVVVGARPEYYGILLCALAGTGALLTTTISAGSLNTSAYTVKNSATQLNLIINNKDAGHNLQFAVNCPSAVESATLQVLTAASLSATSGVTIQDSAVSANGSFSPEAAYGLVVSGETFKGYVPAASAALITITLG
jgi:hypothetical protein